MTGASWKVGRQGLTSTGLFYAPSAAEAFLLALIRGRESSYDYLAITKKIGGTASGAYQDIDRTWLGICQQTGVGLAYPRAYLAPPVDQDYNNLWLLRQLGPNSTGSWAASGPYPTVAECEKAILFA